MKPTTRLVVAGDRQPNTSTIRRDRPANRAVIQSVSKSRCVSNYYGADELIKMTDSLSVTGFVASLPNPPDGVSLTTSRGVTENGNIEKSDLWEMYAVNARSESEIILSAATVQLGYLSLTRHVRPNSVDVVSRARNYWSSGRPHVCPDQVEGAVVNWIKGGHPMSLFVIGSGDPVVIANSLHRIDRSRFDELLAANPMPVNSLTTAAPAP